MAPRRAEQHEMRSLAILVGVVLLGGIPLVGCSDDARTAGSCGLGGGGGDTWGVAQHIDSAYGRTFDLQVAMDPKATPSRSGNAIAIDIQPNRVFGRTATRPLEAGVPPRASITTTRKRGSRKSRWIRRATRRWSGSNWTAAISTSPTSGQTSFADAGSASPGGFEPPTFGLGNHCSILLSYEDFSRAAYSM